MKLAASLAIISGTTSAFELDVFLRGGNNRVYTWRDAKNHCMSLKDGWQLVVIDSAQKQIAVQKAFIEAGAVEGDAAWIGYLNEDGWGSNTANKLETIDIYGNRAEFNNYAPNEPNNKYGDPSAERGEDCVKMRFDGTWEDALCGRRHTTKPQKGARGIFNSFICEPKPLEDEGSCVALSETPTSEKYEVVPASSISFNEAREQCQNKGAQWDLAVFESEEELDYVKKLINCLPEAFWVGYRENNGVSVDIHGKPSAINMPWETNKPNGDPDEPDSPDEECVRMQNGKMNDAICTRTWSGAMRDGVGMGYVCERHLTKIPQPQMNSMSFDIESTCEENIWGIKPFKVRPSCPQPLFCEASVEVMDAWTRKDQNSKRIRHGVAIRVTVSETVISKSSGRGYSILVRFPETVTKASFQVWNMNFFNFYQRGTEILFHSKWWNPNTTNFDPELNSFVLVADNMDEKAHPLALAFVGRTSAHACFDPSMHSGARMGGTLPPGVKTSGDSAIRAIAQAKYEDVTLDNVQRISMNRGQIKQVKAVGGKRRNRL